METLTAKATMQETPEEMTLRRLVLFPDSPFVGKTIKESGIREHYQCLVVGVEDEGEEGLLMPDPMQLLRNGDIIWVVGEEANITQLEGSRHQTG